MSFAASMFCRLALALFTIAFSVTILHLVTTWLEAQDPMAMSRIRTIVDMALPPGAVTGPDGIRDPCRGVPAVDLHAYRRRHLG